MKDTLPNITEVVMTQLATLRRERKFLEEGLYPGSPTEAIRLNAESHVNRMLDRIQKDILQHRSKAFVFSQFSEMLKNFENEDTEEREHACAYCEQVMDLFQIESSEGLLNNWLYGREITDGI